LTGILQRSRTEKKEGRKPTLIPGKAQRPAKFEEKEGKKLGGREAKSRLLIGEGGPKRIK